MKKSSELISRVIIGRTVFYIANNTILTGSQPYRDRTYTATIFEANSAALLPGSDGHSEAGLFVFNNYAVRDECARSDALQVAQMILHQWCIEDHKAFGITRIQADDGLSSSSLTISLRRIGDIPRIDMPATQELNSLETPD